MGHGVRNLILFSWTSFLFCAGVILFTRGFLLKRHVMSNKTTCYGEVNRNISHLIDGDLGKTTSSCWLPSRYNKAVIIVIDGLRYDFIHFNASLEESGKRFYHNKFPFIWELLENKPQQSALLKFVADPPTTTLQRIKGLITGSLPTFIDASNNFASSEIDEDNLIDQLVNFNKKVTFMGDDTWMGLLPRRFSKAIPFPSFNVKDLHSVDDGILKHLVREIKSKDWDVVIAHFLGVDHCGHRYGPNHIEMSKKLMQMNDMLRSVIESLPSDTILFVLGDHGMTVSGDHGGDSSDEITSALFVFSPSRLWDTLKPPPLKVNQIDLVPTFSLLLGVPIPFGNLGTVIKEFMIMEEGSTIGNFENDDVKNLYFGAHGLYRNAKQVDLYLKAYNAVSDDLSSDSEKVIQLQNMLMEVDKLWEMISSGTLQPTNLTTSLHIVENLTYDFLQLARSMCSSVWAQFDLSSMLVGLAIFSLALIVIVFEITSSLQTNWTGISMFGGFTIIGTTILVHLYYPLITSIRGYECSILIIIVIMSALYFILTLQNHQYKKCIAMKYMLDCEHLPVIVVALMFAVFFSNSYVVCEDSVVSFLTISLLGYKALFSNLDRKQGKRIERKSKQKSLPFPWYRFRSIVLAVVSGVCIRAFTMFKKCREEQWWCAPTDVFRSLSDISTSSSNYTSFKSWRFFISIICVWALILSFQWLLRRAGNLNGFLPAVMCATYAPAIMGICICFYWALQCLPSTLFGHILQQYEVVLPNVVFIVAALCIIVLLLRPLCIYTVFQNNDNIGPILSGDKGEIFHLVYRYIKGNWRKHLSLQHGESKKNTVIVYGLASVFSASVFAAIIIVTPTLILLTNDGLALAFLILVVAAASGLQCLVQSKYSGRQYDESISIPWSWVLLWSLLSSIGFYGTGHQYTFTSLHWNAALVGSDGQFTNYVLPAIKVLLNTFSSTLLFAMSLPLLLLWPFTSRLIFDNEVHHMSETSDDIKKGEFVLHGEPRFFRALFDLSTKYLAVQGIKLLGSMLAAAILRRHLMVWKIFAPRFVFEAVNFLFVILAVSFAYVLMISVHYALDIWIKKINRT